VTTTNEKTTAQIMRQESLKRLLRRFGTWVVLPTVLACIYYGFVASSEYESVGIFALRTLETSTKVATETTRGGKSPDVSADGRIGLLLQDYARSRDMLGHLNKSHGFARHFQSDEVDWMSRLASDSKQESQYAIFREKVSVEFTASSGALHIRALAFSAETAQAFVTAIGAALKMKMHEIRERSRAERLSIAERDMAVASTRFSSTRVEFAKKRSATRRPPVVPTAAGSSEPVTTAPVEPAGELPRIEELQYQQAKKRYHAAATRVRMARIADGAPQRYMMAIARPSLPDVAARPKRLWSVATVFVVALLLMGVLGLLSAAVREHANF
jgi:capsule polysaccharide export protein KpsE/RkpR